MQKVLKLLVVFSFFLISCEKNENESFQETWITFSQARENAMQFLDSADFKLAKVNLVSCANKVLSVDFCEANQLDDGEFLFFSFSAIGKLGNRFVGGVLSVEKKTGKVKLILRGISEGF